VTCSFCVITKYFLRFIPVVHSSSLLYCLSLIFQIVHSTSCTSVRFLVYMQECPAYMSEAHIQAVTFSRPLAGAGQSLSELLR
jgi:hypothetical protein